MTLKRWVDSLFLGTWHLPDGSVFECTPEDRDYYYHRSKEMINSGLPVPVCLEHQPTVGLSFHQRQQEWTAGTIGHCHDVRVGDEGQLQYLVDADSEDEFAKMRRNKFVSPEIRQNVLDPRTGKRWEGPSIVHLAVTPRPIQVTGKPHVRLSSARAVSLSRTAVDVSLSQATYEPISGAKKLSQGETMHDHYLLSEKATAATHNAAKTGGKNEHAIAYKAHMNASQAHAAKATEHENDRDLHQHHSVMAEFHKNMADHHQKQFASQRGVSMSAAKQDDDETTPGATAPEDDDDLTPPPPASGADDGTVSLQDIDTNQDGQVSPDELDSADKAAEAEAMTSLEHELAELGIEFHGSASDSMLNFLQHLTSCIKTHKATKAGGNGAQDDQSQQQQQPDQYQQNPNQPQEQETAESAPIMMSNQPTKLESVLAQKVLKDSLKGRQARINSLHARGYIDDGIKKDMLSRLGTVKLSSADIDPETGDVRPDAIEIEIAAYEKLAKSGKPGSFAKPAAQNTPAFNPKKPISSSVSLSNAQEEVAAPHYQDDPNGEIAEGEIVPEVLDRLTGGRYTEYAKQNQAS